MVEDIENISATITITGPVTVSGNVTVHLNSSIAVTQSGSWNIANISGTVAITGPGRDGHKRHGTRFTNTTIAVTGAVTHHQAAQSR